MKFLVLIALTVSMSAFAGRVGYNCIAANPAEQMKLDRVSMTIGPQYKPSARVIIAKARDCAEVITGLQAQCLVGSYNLNIFNPTRAELVVNPRYKIKLICEPDRPISPQPAGGGSN